MLPEQALRWDKLLQTVRADYPDVYRSWFEELAPGRLEGGELQVQAPQATHRQIWSAINP